MEGQVSVGSKESLLEWKVGDPGEDGTPRGSGGPRVTPPCDGWSVYVKSVPEGGSRSKYGDDASWDYWAPVAAVVHRPVPEISLRLFPRTRSCRRNHFRMTLVTFVTERSGAPPSVLESHKIGSPRL